MLAVSCAMPVLCFLVTRVESQAWALAVVSALFFGHAAWGNITLPTEVFPRHAVGTVTGLGGALGGLMGVLTQPAIGWGAQNLSFAPIFPAMSVAYLLALGLVQLLLVELCLVR